MSLVRMPVPMPPQWWMVVPMHSSIGLTVAKSWSSAPTMNRHSPRSAWLASRPMGASQKRRPAAASRAAMASVAAGSTVLRSTMSVPGAAVEATPSSPNSTCSTS